MKKRGKRGKQFLNPRRKKSMIAFFYKLTELLIAGVGLAGLLNGKTSKLVVGGGFGLAFLTYAIAFYLEGDP